MIQATFRTVESAFSTIRLNCGHYRKEMDRRMLCQLPSAAMRTSWAAGATDCGFDGGFAELQRY